MAAKGPGRDDLTAWIARQAKHSVGAIEQAISATDMVRRREAFGQTVVPVRGSVLGSRAIGDWDPAPDYFFHWVRDSGIVMRTVAELMEDAEDDSGRDRWRNHFRDFVRFSLGLCDLDGATFLATSRHRETTRPDHQRFLRPDDEIRGLAGDALLGEPRFHPDGTIDVQRWSRPQYDGPALRALACLRYLAAGGEADAALTRLLRLDLDFTRRHADATSIGAWEEPAENVHHYHVALVQLGALVHGRDWIDAAAEEVRLRAGLDRHWSGRDGVYVAIRDSDGDAAEDRIDASQVLAVLDADLPEGRHSAQDDRVMATAAAIEDLFSRAFPINRDLPPGWAPALGRYRGDRFFGGGAWFVTTLAAAGLRYRRALCPGEDVAALVGQGDAFMATVRAMAGGVGPLPEQVDRTTGLPVSARDMTWNHAAFLSTVRLRREASARRG